MADAKGIFRRRKKPGPKPKEETQEKQAAKLKEDASLTAFVGALREHYEKDLEENLDEQVIVAHLLADGRTVEQAATGSGVSERTIYRWKHDDEFMELVDRLSLTTGIATSGGRMRLTKRVVRQIIDTRTKAQQDLSDKDLLDWQKEARAETKETTLISDEQAELIAALIAGDQSETATSSGPEEDSGKGEGQAARD